MAAPMAYEAPVAVELLRSAIREMRGRLVDGDVESCISMCDATEVALAHGIDSPEMHAFMAIASARLA